MSVWKRNLIAAAVLVTVCAGIYVNWLYTEDQAVMNLSDTLNAEKLMDSDAVVMGTEGLPEVNEVNVSDYFSAVRLSRQQARDSAVGLLQEAMAYSDEDDTETSAQLESIVQTALSEAQIESLVIAKGYADCVAYISESGISIAVAAPEGGLQAEDVAVIADIVISQTSHTLEDIRIVEV